MVDLTLGAHVTPIKDMDRAVKFYSELLGLTVKMKDETISILDAGAAQVWLYDYGGALEPGGPTQSPRPASDRIISFEEFVRPLAARRVQWRKRHCGSSWRSGSGEGTRRPFQVSSNR